MILTKKKFCFKVKWLLTCKQASIRKENRKTGLASHQRFITKQKKSFKDAEGTRMERKCSLVRSRDGEIENFASSPFHYHFTAGLPLSKLKCRFAGLRDDFIFSFSFVFTLS
jgi:hypothetical protein